jgi:L-iditol 2-dehydrogenase
MRVAMYYNNNDVRLQKIPKPKIKKGEILVEVIASGICGSDVMEWYRIKKAPLVLGHEITGVIIQSKSKYKLGKRVFVSHHVPCEVCEYCIHGHHTVCETLRSTNFDPGGFSEYIRVPKVNVEHGVYVLPDEMSFEDGTFIEPLGCVVRAQKLAKIGPDSTILIIGSGISGLLHVQLAKARKAKVIAADINEYRMKMAKKLGADIVIDAKKSIPAELFEANKKMADCVIICTSSTQAMYQALHCVDRGGTVIFFAPTKPGFDLTLSFNDLWKNCITLTTSYAAAPDDMKEAIELLRKKKINVKDMITHRFGLAETSKGFKLVAKAKESIKVIIEPQR